LPALKRREKGGAGGEKGERGGLHFHLVLRGRGEKRICSAVRGAGDSEGKEREEELFLLTSEEKCGTRTS